jgi:hypothetical protein
MMHARSDRSRERDLLLDPPPLGFIELLLGAKHLHLPMGRFFTRAFRTRSSTVSGRLVAREGAT